MNTSPQFPNYKSLLAFQFRPQKIYLIKKTVFICEQKEKKPHSRSQQVSNPKKKNQPMKAVETASGCF